MQWIKLTERMPNPDQHDRVLIYTEGYDFTGEQVFDVKTETLNEWFYAEPEDQPEVCRVAAYWMPHPADQSIEPIQVGDDTLHGAIDHWQARAELAEQRVASLEAELAALSPVPDRVKFYGMFDNHTFVRFEGAIETVLDQWREANTEASVALCPVLVMAGTIDLRRVGPLVDSPFDMGGLQRWLEAVYADTDIIRLMR